ncbi:hypothetical protein [Halalkalicoccus sp. NIPERK01]|uniref:hypothetical protein n=1 Tax=Halalkalicoccus sp. NIPERK01 TaxID=3053469 RepID=UPI00256F0961|nr:hypothetical protein [Halalkalicoccus sp. NIPERK01]MDL5361097.1 hypothetical protein [Halalkalicoccus sp. NIPERK01]
MVPKWRELLSHYPAMFGTYLVLVPLVAVITGRSDFWISMGVAAVVALGYPPAVRRFDRAPPSWS